MATTGVVVKATAGQRDFDVPFPFLDVSHVKVDVRGTPAAYEWINATRLRLLVPAAAGDTVRIYRKTPISKALVEFQDGATLTDDDLNLSVRQTLFIQQELMDLYTGSLESAKVSLGDKLGIVTTPDALLQELVSMVLAEDVLREFRERIIDIDLNAEAIIGVGLRTDALQTAVDALASLEDGTGIATVIAQEKTERIEGDTALAETIALIGAKSADSLGFILDTNRVKVSPTESLAYRLQAMGSQIGENLALLQSEQETRLSQDEALSKRLDSQGVRLGKAESAIVDERTARATAIEAEATARQQLAAKTTKDISAAIEAERRVWSGALASEASERNTLEAKVNQKVRTFYQSSAPSGAAEGDLWYNTANKYRPHRYTGGKWVDVGDGRFADLLNELAGLEADITTEARVRADQDRAIAETLSLLGAKSGNGQAFIMDASKVQVSPGVSMGQRLSGIDTAVGQVASSVVEERKAWSTATNSLTQRIDGVVSTVGSHTTSITQLMEARDGIYARAGIAVDNNGYVTGWTLNNDGRSGDFTIFADKFRVVTPGNNPQAPFTVAANRIRMNANVEIDGDLLVRGSINNGAIQRETITGIYATYQAATINMNGLQWTTLADVWMDVEGSNTPVVIRFNSWVHMRHDPSGSFTAYFEVRRTNGAGIDVRVLSHTVDGSGMSNDNYVGPLTFDILDRPGPGQWRYYVNGRTSVSNMSVQQCGIRYLSATEHKTN